MNTSDFYFVSMLPASRGLYSLTISDFDGNKLTAICAATVYDELRIDGEIDEAAAIQYVIDMNTK